MRATEMSCTQTRDLLEGYYEDTLPDRQRDKVSAHLAFCSACAAELGQIEKVAAALVALPRAEVSAELLRTISARAAALPAPLAQRVTRRGWRRLGALSAACVALLAVLRYAVPLVWQTQQAHIEPVLNWAKAVAVSVVARLAALPTLAETSFLALADIWKALGAAGRAVGPTLGLYVAAEIGLVVAILLLFGWGRTRARARLTLLV
jgi:hypothetical protein